MNTKCKHCGGDMNLAEDGKSLICPYCGSTEIIEESDAVKIQQIRSDANAEIEREKLKHELEKDKLKSEISREKSFKKSIWSKLLVVFTAISLIVALVYLSDGVSPVGIIALLQVVIYAAAWLVGMGILPVKLKNFSLLLTIVGLLLIIPFIKACNDDMKLGDAEEFAWSELALGEQLPSPDKLFGEIITNSDERLYLKLMNVTQDDYNTYLQLCTDAGFIQEADRNDNSYTAYSSEGYELSLYYSESGESITVELDAPPEFTEIVWPSSGMGSLIPPTKSLTGQITDDSSDSFSALIGNMSREEMLDYSRECEAAGFNIDYDRDDDSYSAFNSDGIKLYIVYEGYMSVSIRVWLPTETEEVTTPEVESSKAYETTQAAETTQAVETTAEEKTETTKEVETTANSGSSTDGIRPEIKEAIDSYEAFFDEYIAFMQSYAENDAPFDMLSDYLDYMTKYADMMQKLDELSNEDLNDAELAYYLEVSARINQKLLDAAV